MQSSNLINDVAVFFQSGGYFMAPILFVLFLVGGVFLQKVIFFIFESRRIKFISKEIHDSENKGEYLDSLETKSMISSIYNEQLSLFKRELIEKNELQNELDNELSIYHSIVRKRVNLLSLLANIATMLGLLGTIIGLIESFKGVSGLTGEAKANALSASISVAMNTTAFGLISAIPLLIMFYFLQSKAKRIETYSDYFNRKLFKHIVNNKK